MKTQESIYRKNIEIKIALIFLLVAIFYFVVHLIYFRYSFPPYNSDEASFFSPSYNFAQQNVLSSTIHQSFLPGASQFTYWMPPFYMVFLGSLMKIFGSTVFSGKFTSWLLTCCSAFLISFISKDLYTKICAASLFLICPFILITSAFIRVEALAILLIVIAIICVKFNTKNYVLGILAGLCFMTHPLLLAVSGSLLLFCARRGWKPLIIFSFVGLLVISPYIFYIFKDFDFFKLQMALQFSRKAQAKITDLKLLYILQSVPIAVIGLFCLYKLKQHKELKIFLATAAILALIVILKSNEFNYQVYLVPFVIASIALLMDQSEGIISYRYLIPVCIYIFFLVLFVFKFVKYNYRTDKSYKEIITYLNNNQNWAGKNIYAVGATDLSNYFIVRQQQIERPIPIAVVKSANWFNKYNFVLEVINNKDQDNSVDDDYKINKPWLNWRNKSSFTTSDGIYSLHIFSR